MELLFLVPLMLWLFALTAPFVLVFRLYCKCIGKASKFSYRGIIIAFIAWFAIIALFLPLWIFPFVDVPLVLLFGWIVGLWRFFSGFRLEWIALLVGTVSLVLFFTALHFFLRSVRRQYEKAWIFRQTLCVGGIMLAISLGGIAILAGIHEIYWVATSDELWFSSGGEAARRMQSSNNLKQIGLGMHNYHDVHKTLSGGTMLDAETPGHSWVTQLLPFVEQTALYEEIDKTVPWTAEKNRKPFETSVYVLQSPKMPNKKNDNTQGYALIHYAINERLLPVGGTIAFGQISDGTSNTILSGEVNGNFRAWGDPINARDPALGINKTPYGFGSRSRGGANMGICDGSVTFISETIEPDILEAIATPNGGESVGVP